MAACNVIVTRKSDKKQIVLSFQQGWQAYSQLSMIENFSTEYEAQLEDFTLRYETRSMDQIDRLFKKKHG